MSNGYDAKNKVALGFYHLDPRWTTYEEFDWFADRGYINSYCLAADTNTMSGVIGGAQKAMENGSQVWLTLLPYLSCEQSLSDYMANVERKINLMKEKGVEASVLLEMRGSENQKKSVEYMKQHKIYPYDEVAKC
jgi:hypothetical protein